MRKKISSLFALLLLPLTALAQPGQPTEIPKAKFDNFPGLLATMKTVANWIFSIFLIVAVIYIILAAFKYLTSRGGESVKDAHKMLVYAAVAIAIAILAPGIVNIIISLVN